MRRFPPPWTAERIEGGFKVVDANGQSIAYVSYREGDHLEAKVLAEDEARRIASNIAKLPRLLDDATIYCLCPGLRRHSFLAITSSVKSV